MSIRTETIGNAILYLADCQEVFPLLAGQCFSGLLTDPPYNSGGRGDKAAPTSAKYQSSENRGIYPEFAGDTLDQRAFFAWSSLWMSRARALMIPGALGCVFSDWRQLPVTTDALQSGGWIWRGIAPWDKTERGRPQKGRFRAQAEYVVWGTNGARPLDGPVAPGVFREPVPHTKHHIAGKPVKLMSELLAPMDDGPILDPFMGSGTVGLARRAAGRAYVGIECVPAYFEIACRRLQESASGG